MENFIKSQYINQVSEEEMLKHFEVEEIEDRLEFGGWVITITIEPKGPEPEAPEAVK